MCLITRFAFVPFYMELFFTIQLTPAGSSAGSLLFS